MESIWIEKYRPKVFDDIIGNKEIINSVRKCVSDKKIPHFLFSGNAGVGKTTLAHVIINEYFKDLTEEEKMRKYLELNASSDRKIDVIREDVNDFAMRSNNIRFIILDEADELPQLTQDALKRIMELNSDYAKFILICNNISKITDPIKSRCVCYEFNSPTTDEILERLKVIAENEKINIDEKTLKIIAEKSNGDVRTSINQLFNYVNGGFKLENIGLVEKIVKLFNYSLNGDFDNSIQLVNDLKRNYNFKTIIYTLRDKIIYSEKVNAKIKFEVIKLICELEYKYNIGVSDYTLLSYLIVKVSEFTK